MIRVRMWNTKQNKMYYPEEMAQDQMCLLPTGQFINVHPTPRFSTILPIDVFIPLLSSTLYDRDGKEIWEADLIINIDRNGRKPHRVIWFDGKFMGTYGKFSYDLYAERHVIEVVGNAYENRELVEKEAL